MFMSLRLALGALRSSKLRAGLTALGVFIGVFTVIVMVGLIEGFRGSVERLLNDELGTDTFWIGKIFEGNHERNELRKLARSRKDIDPDDAEAIATCDLVAAAAPYLGLFKPIYRGDEKTRSVEIIGTTRSYLDVIRLEVADGRVWTEDEAARGARVAVLGRSIVDKLFPLGRPVGQDVRIDGQPFRVIGVLAERGKRLGSDQDAKALIPSTSARRVFGRELESWLVVKATSTRTLPESQDQVIQVLRSRRGVPADADNDFDLVAADWFTKAFKAFTAGIALGLLFIASIALVVGGIGIMNIMLVSVTERTREIGLRKALGARRSAILRQFLVEAVALTSLGGLLGFGAAAAVVTIIGSNTPLPATVPPWAPILALGICSLVGVGFGFFPAMRASRLDPVEALRYE